MVKIVEHSPEEEYTYLFTCKRCGGHLSRNVVTNSHKLGGPGIGFSTILVCNNCLNGSNLNY